MEVAKEYVTPESKGMTRRERENLHESKHKNKYKRN